MDSWAQLLRFFLDKVLGALPAWMLRRFYTQLTLDGHLEVDLRSTAPVCFSVGEAPRMDVYLWVTNKSPYVNVEIERVFIEVWDSQPFVGFETNQKEVVRKLETKTIFCRSYLSEIQRARLREVKDKNRDPQLSIDMVFNTPLGRIQKTIRGLSRFKVDFTT